MNAAARLARCVALPAVPVDGSPPAVRAGGPFPVPLALDLLAAVLSSGAAPHAAVVALAEALDEADDPGATGLAELASALAAGEVLATPPGETDHLAAALAGALALAVRAGLPPADLICAAAARERVRRAACARAAIRRLEVLLVIPAGVCLLPAFVLIGVVPVVLALF